MTADVDLLAHYQALENVLIAHAALWQPVPFHAPTPAWSTFNPALYNALLQLNDAQAARLEQDAQQLQDWLAPHVPDIGALTPLTALPASTGHGVRRWPVGFEWDIPGRKWSQITAFSAQFKPVTPHLVDWCAGKGHLSRSLAFQHGAQVTGLEWNQHLCEAGTLLAGKHRNNVTLTRQDVMDDDVIRHIHGDTHCVALHACGKLHLRLLDIAVQRRAPALCFSPCCYHLIDQQTYVPLTQWPATPADSPRLLLTRDHLRLAVQETVTAKGHARQLRLRKSAWRLGFNHLQQYLRGNDSVLPVPVVPDQYFHADFAEFCRHAAALVGLTLPADVDFQGHEAKGWQQHHRVQRLDLLRHAFRRALEVWLCLDRACWLAQQGYAVTVSTFCDASITPRNILINGWRG